MADQAVLCSLLEEKKISFETFYKSLLNDEVLLPDIGEEMQNLLKRSCNSLKYWGRQLQNLESSTMCFFTTFSESNNHNVTLLEIFKALKELLDLRKIKEIHFPENKRYLGIECYEEEDSQFIKKNFLRVNNCYIVYATWLFEAKIYSGRIHWMSSTIDRVEVSNFLSQYFDIKDMKKTKVLMCDELYVETNIVEFKGLLKKLVDLDKVPHITEFKGRKILITIKGRKPICINCMTIGHIRSECDYFYCSVCKMNCRKSHICNDEAEKVTYAEMMKANIDNTLKDTKKEAWNTVAQEYSPQSEDAWLVVKRSSHKSYARKKISTYTVDKNIKDSMGTKKSNNDVSNEKEICDLKNSDVDRSDDYSKLKLNNQIKRKSFSSSSNEDEDFDTGNSICTEVSENTQLHKDTNLFEVLNAVSANT